METIDDCPEHWDEEAKAKAEWREFLCDAKERDQQRKKALASNPDGGIYYKPHVWMIHSGQFWRCSHGNANGCKQCAIQHPFWFLLWHLRGFKENIKQGIFDVFKLYYKGLKIIWDGFRFVFWNRKLDLIGRLYLLSLYLWVCMYTYACIMIRKHP